MGGEEAKTKSEGYSVCCCKVKERDGMTTRGQAGVKKSYFKMGDIWRVYKQKGGTQGRKDWRPKIERQGSHKKQSFEGDGRDSRHQ